MPDMSSYAPRPTGVRDPRDPKKRNNMFHNPPRNNYFGGAAGAPKQAGTKGIPAQPGDGQRAAGPITDRGKGRTSGGRR